jgi:hypothetical protein
MDRADLESTLRYLRPPESEKLYEKLAITGW